MLRVIAYQFLRMDVCLALLFFCCSGAASSARCFQVSATSPEGRYDSFSFHFSISLSICVLVVWVVFLVHYLV